jgi:hypothetical protein
LALAQDAVLGDRNSGDGRSSPRTEHLVFVCLQPVVTEKHHHGFLINAVPSTDLRNNGLTVQMMGEA